MSFQNFPKSSRLLTKADFEYLRSNSNLSKSKWMMAFHKDRENGEVKTRIGISVSKKVGNAVKRNLLKRQVRECFRKSSYGDLGKDVLFVLHPSFFKDERISPNLKVQQSFDLLFKSILK